MRTPDAACSRHGQHRPRRTDGPPLLNTALQVQAISLGVALLLELLGARSFPTVLLYSVLIGNSIWALIHAGTHLLQRARGERGWPGWRWMLPLILAGDFGGYLLGTLLADLITGHRSALPLARGLEDWRAWGGIVAISLTVAVAATAYFHSRSRIAADPPRAQAMLDRLIAFLRSTLAASRSGGHALADEFERLADDLALIEVRMGPRLRARLDLPDELRALPVPALLLQSPVENAVQHALDPQVAGGRIEVAARREDSGKVTPTLRGRPETLTVGRLYAHLFRGL